MQITLQNNVSSSPFISAGPMLDVSTDNISDWLKLIDYDPENVVKVVPTRPEKSKRKKRENMSVI